MRAFSSAMASLSALFLLLSAVLLLCGGPAATASVSSFFPLSGFPDPGEKKERGRRKRRRRRCRWNQSIGRCRSRVLLHLISLTRTFNSSRSPPIQTGLHARRRGRRRPLPAGAGPERDVSVFPSLIFLFVRFPLCNEGH